MRSASREDVQLEYGGRTLTLVVRAGSPSGVDG
jgi:hypothetical protein